MFTRIIVMRHALPLVLFVFSCAQLMMAQIDPTEDPDWSVLMQNADVEPGEVRALFESHWEGRERSRGSGYKQVERWLHLMENRVDDSGVAWGSEEVLDVHRSILQAREAGRSPHGNWEVCGPTLNTVTTREHIRGVGRMNAIAFHPTDPEVIFAGAPAGGLWQSYDGGMHWDTYTDAFATLGVSSIAFAPSDPTVVYLGTGDRDASDSPGMGVMKSTDGGLTWGFVNAGIESLTVGDLLVHPENTEVIFAATNSGVHRSMDGGLTWQLSSSNTQNYKDLAFHPTNPEIVYSTGQGRFWRSADGGEDWEYINDGIEPSTRMVIAVTPAAPDHVYVLSTGTYEFRAFFKSTDMGLTFEEMSDSPNIMAWSASGDQEGGQAWYDLCVAADPVVVDRIYAGGIRMKRSDDGGATWIDIQDSYTHVDQHALVVNPHTDEIWLANDGGVYRYENNQQWQDVSNGIITGEIYKIGQSPHTGAHAMSGYQDNGTYLFDGVQWSRGSGGDGFECHYDPSDVNWFFSSSQYGRIYRTGPGIQTQTIVANEELGITEGGAWSTPFDLSDEDPNTMFVGLLNVWRSMNVKHPIRDSIVWEKISSELGGNDASTMRVVHRHRSNPNVVFGTEGARKLFRCDVALEPLDSIVWLDLSENLPLSAQPVLDIETVPGDSNRVYIAFNKKVWESEDLGANWLELEGGLPNVQVNSLVYDTTGTGGVYAGTDMGIYYWSFGDSTWIDYSDGFPLNVRVTELELYPGNGPDDPQRLRAGTYGRGMWETDVHGELQGFPPIAYLQPANGETSVFGPVEVYLAFRRNQNDVFMDGLDLNDFAVVNGSISNLESDVLGYSMTVNPGEFGPIDVVVPQGAAVEVAGYELPNAASDTLRLVFHPVPDGLGPWGPGGVGDDESLTFWLRADVGAIGEGGNQAANGEGVTEWRDLLSGSLLTASQSESDAMPTWSADGINGKPSLLFDGENDCVIAPAIPMHQDISVFSMVKGADMAWNDHGWIASARDDNGFILHPWKDQSAYQSVVIDSEGNYAQASPYWIVDASLPQFYGVIYDQSEWDQSFQTIVNDLRIPFPGSNLGIRDPFSFVEVRYGWDYDERFGEGSISEHFIYNQRLFESHRTIVSNYIAARYGVTMGNIQHYFREGYGENVAGIGRESEWDFHDDAQGKGVVRISDPQDMDAGNYLFWGHDDGPIEIVTAYPFQSARLGRTWACETIGEVGEVTLRFVDTGVAELFATGSLGLIVQSGEVFDVANVPEYYPLQNQGAYWSTQVTLPESGLFTLGLEPVMTLGENLFEAGFEAYPNPASDVITFQLNHMDFHDAHIRLLDTSGRLILERPMTQRQQDLDVSSWPAGMYIAEVVKSNQRVTRPIMIVH